MDVRIGRGVADWRSMSAVCLAVVVFGAAPTFGQQVQAIPGEPFGVASIVVRLGDIAPVELPHYQPEMVGPRGRVFYPTISEGRLRQILGLEGPANQLRVWFLFRGDTPFDVTIYSPTPVTVRVSPAQPRRRREASRLWSQWWRNYNATIRSARQSGDYPPLVQSYLVTMLERRLGLTPPLAERSRGDSEEGYRNMLKLLAGTESLHDEMLRAVNSGSGIDEEIPRLPLPEEPEWAPYVYEAGGEPPPMESIAAHVPDHCFYIRYGSYDNYLWQDKLAREFGGDLARMITLRGYSPRHNKKIQQQLALEQSALSDLLGNKVIADVALIGGDLFLENGATIGMLFEAKNLLLGRDLTGQQQRAYQREKENGATLEKVKIAGHDVSLLSTPDNRLRSYYAVDGSFHLVTNSRWLVEQFYAAGSGKRSLKDSPEFQFARRLMPLQANHTIFAFFPTAFFQRLLSPHYQIELRRRLRAVTDIELVMLAKLAAEHEGYPSDSVRQLVDNEFLPERFERRPDGGGPVLMTGGVLDSKRGARGYFTPIPDVAMDAVTSRERDAYLGQLASVQQTLRQFIPLTVGIRRYQHPQNRSVEHIVVDAELAPFDPAQFEWLISMLGEPRRQRVQMPENVVISAEVALRGGILSPAVPPHTMFLGVLDMVPHGDVRSAGLLQWLRILQTTPGFLGAWPEPGFLDLLPIRLGTDPDPAGYSRYLLGLWRRQFQGFSVLSFQRPVLEAVTPLLAIVEDDRPAHLRMRLANLSQTKLEGYLNELSYQRSKQASIGNARLMQILIQQLGVPRERALDTVQRLLNAELICSLGGHYQLTPIDSALPQWRSDKWMARSAAEAEFRAPWLDWFQGGRLRVVRLEDRIMANAEFDMKRTASSASLPFFNLLAPGSGQ